MNKGKFKIKCPDYNPRPQRVKYNTLSNMPDQVWSVVVVFVLLFYVHYKLLRSCWDGQLIKPLFSWAGLELLSG